MIPDRGAPASVDVQLTGELLAHLEIQLDSARRLLGIVLDQGTAIRARDVHRVVACTGLMQAELQRRVVLEATRAALLARAGARLGLDPGAVTIEPLCSLMDHDCATRARAASAELRGLLSEVRQEHRTNRALMQQELAFVDHLLRHVDADHSVGYDAGGDRAHRAGTGLAGRHRVFDLEV